VSRSATLNITILSQRNPLYEHAPDGFGYVGEMFEQARLKDRLTESQSPDAWLAHSLGRLSRRFPRRLRVQWVSLWSLPGLQLAIRYRVRTYPTIVFSTGIVYTGNDPREFEALVIRQLETSSFTPGMVENSWFTLSILTFVTAAPGKDDKIILLKELPKVWPYPA